MPPSAIGRLVPLLAVASLLVAWRASASGPETATTAPPNPVPSLARCLERLGVDRWHAAGCTGRGLTVAVLDTGFTGYRDHLGSALPQHVEGRSFRLDGNLEACDSPHGVLVAEVIHAIAPDAEILLANWEPDSPCRFLEAVRWARQRGAKIINCSVVMPSWSDGEGGGAIHAELARLLGDDALFVACAGNLAERQWAGPYREGPGRWHAWQEGDRCENAVLPWDERPVTVELNWRGSARYELTVFDWSDRVEVGRTPGVSAGASRLAMVRFSPRRGHAYTAQVRLLEGEAGELKLVVLGGGLECATVRGSITFPGDGPEVLTVGAVAADGRREFYSSCGTKKPDCVAPVPLPSRVRPLPFTGTSAAAPQAAGLATLLWGRHLDWSAGRVREELLRTCRDPGSSHPDAGTGAGVIRLLGERN